MKFKNNLEKTIPKYEIIEFIEKLKQKSLDNLEDKFITLFSLQI